MALAVVLAATGVFQAGVAGGSLLALAPALIGMTIGTRMRAIIAPALFKRYFFVDLMALGGYLAARSLAAVF